MKIAYATDLHGNKGLYERLFEEKAGAVVIGGDLLPNYVVGTEIGFETISNGEYFSLMIQNQMHFLMDYLIPRLEKLKKEKKEVYLMMGNDDFSCNLDLLEQAESRGIVKLLYDKKKEKPKFHKISKDIFIAGYPHVPLTPFGIKDWEKFDKDEKPKRDCSFFGYKGYKGSDTYFADRVDLSSSQKNNIAKDLENLASDVGKEKIKKTIFVMHCPPFNMHDKVMPRIDENQRVMTMIEEYSSIQRGKSVMGKDSQEIKELTKRCNEELRKTKPISVGSLAIREFIEKYQPLLTLHGHIHESYKLTGEYRQKIGRTICVNPGADSHNLYAIIFDPNNISGMKMIVKKAKEIEEKPKGP